jgi:hypothetical protein
VVEIGRLLKLATYPRCELCYGFPPPRSTNDVDGDISDDAAALDLSNVRKTWKALRSWKILKKSTSKPKECRRSW